jgi:carbamoyltransferase
MLLVSHVADEFRLPGAGDRGDVCGIDKLNAVRSTIPAVTHVDYSARVQTVDADRHGLLHTMMQQFYERTGCPVIVNTSFNVRGEPIVCAPVDAYRCFQHTDIDALVLGNHLLLKSRQAARDERSEHLAQFHLD